MNESPIVSKMLRWRRDDFALTGRRAPLRSARTANQTQNVNKPCLTPRLDY